MLGWEPAEEPWPEVDEVLLWVGRLGADWGGRPLFMDQVALLQELEIEDRLERDLYFELIAEWSLVQAEIRKEKEDE